MARVQTTPARQAVIELKTGCGTDTIAKKDVDQLGGSISWLNKNNPQVKPLPLMVHPSRVCDAKATPQAGKRVVTPARYELSKQAVVQHAVALASDLGRWGDEQAVAAQLAHHKRTSDRFLDTYSEVARTSA